MNNAQLKEKLLSIDSNLNIVDGIQYLTIIATPENLHQTALTLKNNQDLSFDYLFCLTGNDLADCCSVVYHLESTRHGHAVVLKVNTKNRENAEVDTVCDIWETANFHEREVFDLVGINFKNHPDMRRMFLNEEDWVGYPLRKDYTDNNIVSR